MRGLRPDEPRVIGDCRLVGVIGAGGMGRVFLAVAPTGGWPRSSRRAQLVGEAQLRIGACRTAVPPDYTRWTLSPHAVPGVDEQASFLGLRPVPPAYPEFPPQVLGCTVARVDAVVLRACANVTSAPGDLDPITGAGRRVAEQIRGLLAPVVTRARELQADG